MPHVRNFYYRTIRCPLCQKKIELKGDNWFCSKKCEEEWKILNGDYKNIDDKKVKGRDTSG